MDNVPNEYLCPITLSIMEDPVLMPDGQTYERSAIEIALSVSPLSPITRQPMKIEDAVPNYALKSLIESYQAQHTPMPGTALPQQDLLNLDYFGATTLPDPNNNSNELVHVCVRPHEIQTRSPIALIAMIDVSGSMSNNCCQVSGLEDLNLTRLQLVKHALKTVISTLSDSDEITLITFDTTASVLLPSTRLNSQGKERVTSAIDSMVDKCATNIWDALKLGIDCAFGLQGKGFNISLMLFTDGEPNRNPPMGIIPSLEEYLSGRQVDFTISSFGFGYQLDSELLEGIARIGNGVYGYCPDCTMVGTVFINYMANALCQLSSAKLIVRGPTIDTKVECTLFNGSSRNFLFILPKSSISETHFLLEVGHSGVPLIEGSVTECKDENDRSRLRDQYWRKRLLDLLENSLTNCMTTAAQSLVQVEELFAELTREDNPTKWMRSLMMDLVSESANHGQVAKAFSQQYYMKWGKDYLRSFMRFHMLELCGNFKDESLQNYGGPPFMSFRKIANKLFSEIPPPEPIEPEPEVPSVSIPVNYYQPQMNNNVDFTTCKSSETEASRGSSMASICGESKSRMRNMSRLYTRYSGCFGGSSYAKLMDGSVKKVYNLRKGDRLNNGMIVNCVVKIKTKTSYSEAVTINGAIFTPWHPIKIDGKWMFPANIAPIECIPVDFWYNLVLSPSNNDFECNKTVILNGIEAITLGHGMKGRVVEHPYFGTEKVIHALKRKTGYSSGYIEVEEKETIRDASGLVSECF